MCKLNVLKEI